MLNQIKAIKKAELHRHLEGSIRLSTLIELSGQTLTAEDFLVTTPLEDLTAVLQRFFTTQKLLSTPEIIERVTYEVCEDAYKDGINILELRYAPSFLSIGHAFSWNNAHSAVMRGIQRAEKQFPMVVGVLGIIVRSQSFKEARKCVDFFIQNKKDFIGMDLADEEVGFDCKIFAPLFQDAKKEGLRITVHSGEEDVPQAPQFVRDAIELLGAERIGHGLQIYKDRYTIDFVKERNVCLELCPTSNWITNNVKSLEKHPFPQLHEAGVAVTINSDDPGIMGFDLSNEYLVLHKHFDYSIQDLEAFSQVAKNRSFISSEKINSL